MQNRYSTSISLQRERRLYIQMLGLFIGFTMFLVYHIMQFIYSLNSNDGPIFTMRIVFPLVSVFFSYVNAWMILFFNDDIRAKIFVLIGLRKQKVKLFNNSYRWVSVILQWTVPMLYSIPLLLFSDATFKGLENMEVLVQHKDITIATSMTAVFVTTTFTLCSFCYVNILRFLIRNRFALSQALKRERRLYAQMMGLFVGFVLLFIFYALIFSFSLNADVSENTPIFTMRMIFPLVNCFFSYINPWMMLILNVDIRRKVLTTVGQVAACELFNNSYRWISVIVQWTVPMLYSIPLLLFSDATFKGLENMEVLVQHKDITIFLGHLMALSWSQWIFVVVNIVSLPLYLLIITGIVDISVMASYFVFGVLRSSELFNSIFWTYQYHYVASWCFNQTYVLAFIRCFGVLLMSFQRYISLCKNGRPIEQIVNVSHRWTLPLLHWLLPFAYSIPLLILSNATFKDEKNLEVATSMAAIFVSISFILCASCYGAILRFLIVNRYSSSVAVKRERRLYVQMLGLFVAFILLLVFNIMQFRFSLYSNDGPIFTMRMVFPVISCFFSYINVWMMLILNDDMRRKILALLGVRDESVQSSFNRSTSTKVVPMGKANRF
ncbi:unnamed protein product [Haemonchus placei]|uniref:G protein-coupled receptor n=1 Tax=Haemonchus placei TaxID=6290 RepID=A0A158QR78_HAEPC|nr:unnamed protein product [Haemonchus placei]